MKMKMDKHMHDALEMKFHDLWLKRDILFRAFAINYAVIVVAWIMTMIPFMHNLIMKFAMYQSVAAVELFYLYLFGMWKILGVVLFLIPALALWWQMHVIKKWLQ